METLQSSSPTIRYAYDVFLCFKGKDTRKGFTDHLYIALVGAGFHTFRDDEEIEKGSEIESELKRAIEKSRISIIVLSKNFASSRRCLDELVEILSCHKTFGQYLLPVFYDVLPWQVRWQDGSFAEAFATHEARSNQETDERERECLMDRIETWRAALKGVAVLSGMVLQNEADGHEAKFIKKIVKVIGDILNRRVLRVAPYLIGIDSKIENINTWLQDESTNVNVIAICGMGGIGKTTIAKFVYNQWYRNFDASSFLANVKEHSEEPNGLVNLQRQLLLDIGRKGKVSCLDEGIVKIQHAVCCKRVLLVLDDVDDVDQLHSLFGMRNWYTPGSKIIVTTRNEWLLKPQEAHKLEVPLFNIEDSLELFSWHAFGQDHPVEEYFMLSWRVALYCGGLPIALQVLGSSFSGRSIEFWESALQKLEAITDNQILKKLKISFDSLEDDHDRNLFLDIACFFVGRDEDLTTKILDQCGFYTTVGIQNLIDRFLLTVDTSNKFAMHQLLRDMGREIVRLESPKEPGKRSRLWHHKDAFNVLTENIGTDAIEGLNLDMHMLEEDKPTHSRITANNFRKRKHHEILANSEEGSLIKPRRLGLFYRDKADATLRNSLVEVLETNAFGKMRRLRLLQLNYVELYGEFNEFPKTLRWLCWHGFPLQYMPSDFPIKKLIAFEMHHSSLRQVWKGDKVAHQLKVIDLSHSQVLIKTPNFLGLPSLEMLILESCLSLVEVDESIGKLQQLVLLNLKNCKKLRQLPRSITLLRCLETLIISGCSCINELPKDMTAMHSLKKLHADGITSNKEVGRPWHASIWSWLFRPKSKRGILEVSLPTSLVDLSFHGCDLKDDSFPMDFSKLFLLRKLDLSETLITDLPQSIRGLTGIQILDLTSCQQLKSLVSAPHVKELRVSDCPSLKKMSYRPTSSRTLGLFCRHCNDLVEIEGWFKLEPLTTSDIDLLRAWGFFNIESIIDVKINYYNRFSSAPSVKLSLQGLYESGVRSYFLPWSEVPSEFSIKSTGSLLSFLVPSLEHVRLQGLIVCCLYKSVNESYRLSLNDTISTRIENKTKHVKWTHYPMVMGCPRAKEDMVWVSHWNFGADLLEDGDTIEVSVNARPFEAKESAVQLVYAGQVTQGETRLNQDLVPGKVWTGDGDYFISDIDVIEQRIGFKYPSTPFTDVYDIRIPKCYSYIRT